MPNLWILPAGLIPPQPVELLGSNVMKDHITRWRNEFDHIIIDTPPCLSVTDAVVLSPRGRPSHPGRALGKDYKTRPSARL